MSRPARSARRALTRRSPSTLQDLIPDSVNANRGTPRGLQALDRSLRDFGAGRAIVIDRAGRIIAGNKTAARARALGLPLRVVQTDGEVLVAVQRRDLDLTTDPRARDLALADNRVGELDLEWDVDVLLQLQRDGVDLSPWWSDEEFAALLNQHPAPGKTDENAVVEPGPTSIQRGDLFRARDHHPGDRRRADGTTVRINHRGKKERADVMTTPRRFTYRRPRLYPKQEAALFTAMRYGIIEATTKSGKTVGTMAWLLEQAMIERPGDNLWWVAPVSTQASMVFDRFKRQLPRGTFTANETHKVITLVNGTRMWFKSGDNPDSLFGEDVFAAVMDEATRCKEDAWHAVRTTLTATKGRVRVIGNVKGRNNWAYRLARRAEAGDPTMHYAKITARDAVDAGIFDAEELADAERTLPAAVFRELYYAEASDDQGNPFGHDAIRRCLAPLSGRDPVVWGWDLAKSGDWTVGIGLDRDGVVCRFERRQGSWEQIFDTIVALTGQVPALVDSTGVGDPIVERLQRVSGGMVRGFHFSAPTKQQLMEGLAVAIQQHRVRFPDGPITSELEIFEYAYTRTGVRYCAPEGFHDDCVCALALAVRHYAMEFDLVPLGLVTGSDPEGGTGARTAFDCLRAFLAPPVNRDWRCPE